LSGRNSLPGRSGAECLSPSLNNDALQLSLSN
jgi:hypothetical protein